jgi:transcriptional regulator with XRE-family HTH domain
LNQKKFLYHRIRELRKEKGLTLEQFTQRLLELSGKKFTPATISHYEKGTYEPAPSLLPFIAGVLGVSIEDLFGNDEDGKEEELGAPVDQVDELEKQLIYWNKNPEQVDKGEVLKLFGKSVEIGKKQKEEIKTLNEKFNEIKKILTGLGILKE